MISRVSYNSTYRGVLLPQLPHLFSAISRGLPITNSIRATNNTLVGWVIYGDYTTQLYGLIGLLYPIIGISMKQPL